MIPSPTLPWFELARFRRSRLTRAAIVGAELMLNERSRTTTPSSSLTLTLVAAPASPA